MIHEIVMPTGFPRGEYRDVLRDSRGELIWSREFQPNLIVDGLRNLLAGLLKGDLQAAPLTHWAVGVGDSSWDAGGAPSESSRRTIAKLYREAGRKPIPPGNIKFLGGAFTNQIEINQEFTAGDLSAPLFQLREFGLFAGGSAAADTGLLINHRAHPRIDMQPGFTLQRTLRLTF